MQPCFNEIIWYTAAKVILPSPLLDPVLTVTLLLAALQKLLFLQPSNEKKQRPGSNTAPFGLTLFQYWRSDGEIMSLLVQPDCSSFSHLWRALCSLKKLFSNYLSTSPFMVVASIILLFTCLLPLSLNWTRSVFLFSLSVVPNTSGPMSAPPKHCHNMSRQQ